jgi:hypothetical protein
MRALLPQRVAEPKSKDLRSSIQRLCSYGSVSPGKAGVPGIT